MSLPILIAGDSYSIDWPREFQKLVSTPVYNISSEGRSNLFITTSILNFLLPRKDPHLVIFGNSFLTRTDTWMYREEANFDYWEKGQHMERKLGNRSVPLQHFPKKYEEWYKWTDICVLWQQYYRDIFCLAQTLKSLNHRFFFFNAAENEMQGVEYLFRGYLEHTPYYNWCHNQDNILPGNTFSIKKWCEENNVEKTSTHHINTSAGCMQFSKWMLEQLRHCKLI